MTVAMAFDYFERSHIDVAVVEVGMGGRLDSTNIITPDLSVITILDMIILLFWRYLGKNCRRKSRNY
jgi:folylpolyglutamate synthase/dihydropteroate synthase